MWLFRVALKSWLEGKASEPCWFQWCGLLGVICAAWADLFTINIMQWQEMPTWAVLSTQTSLSPPYLKYKILFPFFLKERLLKTELWVLGTGLVALGPQCPGGGHLTFFNDADDDNRAWLAPQATALCIAWEVVLNKCYKSMLGSQRDSHIPCTCLEQVPLITKSLVIIGSW